MKLQATNQDEVNPISVIRKELTIGKKTVWAYMDAKGKYYLNFYQIEELLGLYRDAFFGFLVRTGCLSSSDGSRENAGFKNQKELRTAWGNNTISAHGVHYVQTETGAKYRAAEIDLVTQFIRFWDKKENPQATQLTDALMSESFQIRCEAAFTGVSPNVTDIIEGTNHWLASREMNQSVHGAFQQYCMSNRIPAAHVHDRMTKHVFNQTARMAIKNNQLVGSDSSIGLDYQDSIEGQLLMAKMKVKFMSYKKGTWQQRADRCFIDSI